MEGVGRTQFSLSFCTLPYVQCTQIATHNFSAKENVKWNLFLVKDEMYFFVRTHQPDFYKL